MIELPSSRSIGTKSLQKVLFDKTSDIFIDIESRLRCLHLQEFVPL